MITYVDTSTLIKLIVDEEGSDRADAIWQSADHVAAASLILVEARAALASAARLGRLTNARHQAAKSELEALHDDLHVVAVTDQLVVSAADVAEIDGLRGCDAVHLAAALEIGATVLASADTALCGAAARRGLHTANLLADSPARPR